VGVGLGDGDVVAEGDPPDVGGATDRDGLAGGEGVTVAEGVPAHAARRIITSATKPGIAGLERTTLWCTDTVDLLRTVTGSGTARA
jgi:hypothetical protein